jgi:hypothetical protein
MTDTRILITEESHFHIHQVMEDLSHDGGGRAGHKAYRLHLTDQDAIEAEVALANMSADDRKIFAIGSEDEQLVFLKGDRALRPLHHAMNFWFDEGEQCACSEVI